MPADFNGTWLNTQVSDSTPRFFAEGLEWNFIQRNLARAAGYGKGKLSHVLTVSEDGKKVTNTMNMPEEKTFTWIVDGENQKDDGAGNPYKAYWDGDKLVVEPGEGADPTQFVMTRYLGGATMVTELTYPNKPGVEMKRYFEKQ